MMLKTLAIFSPGQNAYSETFILAHKKLPFTIRYYYDGYLPTKLEGADGLAVFTLAQQIEKKLKRNFNLAEHALKNSLLREKVDVVLAEYGTTACASLKVVQYLKLPLVVHFHGYDAAIKSVVAQNAESYKKVFDYARAVIVVSKTMREALVKLGCPQRKLILSVYGPHPGFFNILPSYNTQQFLFIGRFVEKKAPSLTINAFKKVTEIFPGAKLVMAGAGELLAACKKQVAELGITANVEFKGVQTPVEIQALLGESIAVVQHSITAENGDSEGTPIAILEAQAAGLPVISTYHAGIPDVVVNNETGLLVQENDVGGMAKNMIRLLREEGLVQKLGAAGRQRIAKNFTLEKHLKTIEQVIEKSLANETRLFKKV